MLAGGAILFPSLGLLFTLTLRGRLFPASADSVPPPSRPLDGPTVATARGRGLGARLAVALLVIGVGMLNAASAPWAHAIGVVSLLGFIVVAFAAIVPRALAQDR